MARNIFTGWDLWTAASIAVVAALLLPPWVASPVAKEIYGVGISVLSIVFAVFFTALAVIMAAGDDEFVLYLKGLRVYERLMRVFRFTVWLLFIALFSSVGLFVFTVMSESMGYGLQSKWALVAFSFLFPYAMFATIGSTHDSFNYSKYRIAFIESKARNGR